MTEQVQVQRIPAVPGMALATEKLIERLKAGRVGEVVTDEELTRVAGKNTRPNGDGYANLQSAIGYVSRRHQVVWSRQRGACAIKCLSADEIVTAGESDLETVHRRSKRAVLRLNIASSVETDAAKLPRLHALLAQHGTLAAFSRHDTLKKLEARQVQQPLDMKRLLEGIAK